METCQGSTVMMLTYRRKSVSEISSLCGSPSHIFMLLLRCPYSFTLADLLCKKHWIHMYILPETPFSGILSRGPSHQTLSKAFIRLKKAKTAFFCIFFGYHSFSIPVADWGCSQLLYSALYQLHVQGQNLLGWAPLRLGTWLCLYLTIHRDNTITTISRLQHSHAIVMGRCMILTPLRRQAFSDLEGLYGCNFWNFSSPR